MNVQSLWLVVHSAHAIRLENAMFLWEIGLGEGLGVVSARSLSSDQAQTISSCVDMAVMRCIHSRVGLEYESKTERRTYQLIVLVTQLLAHELAHPVISLASVLGLQTGNYERHVDSCGVGEVSL